MFVPLQECGKEEILRVGVRAKNMAVAAPQTTMPFSLVLTSDTFDEFLSHNGLGDAIDRADQASTTDMQIKLFAHVQEQILKGRFNEKLHNHLKECFELVCLDTESLGDQAKHCILALQRSTDYEDKDYTTPTFAFSTDKFHTFLDAIKQMILGLFTPASIADRLQSGIKVFTSAFIVTRLPNFSKVLEVEYEHGKRLNVGGYVGFIDPGRVVHRDEFIVGEDFLRIQQNMVVDQQGVAIFDLDRSTVVYKEFRQGGAQSAPNQVVLEVGRLAKRAREAVQSSGIKAVFVGNDQQLFCLTIRSRQQSKAHQKSQARQKLATELITFLQAHKYPEFESQIIAATQRLQANASAAELKDTLQLALSIMQFEK